MRPIDADVLLDAIDKMIGIVNQNMQSDELKELTLTPLRHIKELVTELPTIEVEKTGKWISHSECTWECSNCGKTIYDEDPIYSREKDIYDYHPYCQWCGAKMTEIKNKGRT